MNIPINKFTQEQKFWYAQLIVGAVLADGQIDAMEIDFLKEVLAFLAGEDEHALIMDMVRGQSTPDILAPDDDIAPDILASIFVQLILIVIVDCEMSSEEKDFLKEVAVLFRFTDFYTKILLKWAETGLQWKQGRAKLAGANNKSTSIPLKHFSEDQKYWYANLIVTAILSDDNIDIAEIEFLKKAVSFVSDKKNQQRLMQMITIKNGQKLTKPEGISEAILMLIVTELLLIISSDGAIAIREKLLIKNICEVMDLPTSFYDRSMQWCELGVLWQRETSSVINKCQIKHKSLQTDHRNESLRTREVFCYICASNEPIAFFQLRNKSQKVFNNVFGVPTYQGAIGKYNPVDYNHFKVGVCPNCFFASMDIKMFRLKEQKTPPEILVETAFFEKWHASLDERKKQFQVFSEHFGSEKRTIKSVFASYQLAIKTYTELVKYDHHFVSHKQLVSLMLTFAEILVSNQRKKPADDFLKQAKDFSESFMMKLENPLDSAKIARLQVFMSLYFENYENSNKYLTFLLQTHQEFTGDPKNAVMLGRLGEECKNAYGDRLDYSKKNLMGFLADS
ncbi:MAG: hypothetical protein ACI86H_002006 [bacterium]|jgi:uncharacterized protein (DUF2225 family)